ncbi:MAG TPA: EamA family transporter, partial [Candidatus Diapherotrites archaeon]|nr:EamA family transporter [Candidatus Diapherotrites archaeon]
LQISSFGIGDFAILVAVLLWAFEITIAKKALQRLSGTIVAFGRMFFGSITILAFLAFTNQASGIFSLNTLQLEWVLLTSAFLFAYVLTFYNGLKFISVSKAAIILLAAIPITAFLSMLDAKPFTLLEILANSFLLASIIFAVFSLDSAKAFLRRRFSWKI